MSRSTYILLILIMCGAFLAAQATARAQTVYPAGLERNEVVDGVFAGENAGDCCWMGPRGTLRISAPSGADQLVLKVYLPAYAASRPQALRVRINDARQIERCCLSAGEHDLFFPLPQTGGSGAITIAFAAQRSFEPKKLGINNDDRDLSMILREVAFKDSATGELLERSPSLWASSRSHVPYLVVGGILALLLALRRPIFGVLALVASDPFLFAYTYHGKLVTLPKIVLVAVAVGIASRLIKVREKPSRAFYFLAASQVAFLATMLPGLLQVAPSLANSEFVTAFEYLATFVVAYFAYRIDPDEKPIRIALAALTITVSVLAFLQATIGAAETELVFGRTFARLAGQLEGPNQLAGLLDVILPVILAFIVIRGAMLFEYVALGAGALTCLLTFSRAGVASLVLACAVLLALRFFPARRALTGGAALAIFGTALGLAFGVFAGALQGRIASLFGSSELAGINGGLGSRVDLWHGAFAMWQSHPLFGVGVGNFEQQIGGLYPGVRTHANGMFFQVLAEQGLTGLLAMFAVIAAAIAGFVRRLDEPLALGACMATVALTFHQIGDCMWLFPKVGVLWWVILALAA